MNTIIHCPAFVVVIVFLLGVTAGCNGSPGQNLSERQTTPLTTDLPAGLTDAEKLRHLAQHWWDGFDAADTVQLDDSAQMSQMVGEYVQVLLQVPDTVAQQSLACWLDRLLDADAKRTELSRHSAKPYPTFSYFTNLMEYYLWNPVSPLRNDDLYALALRHIVAMPRLDDVWKERPRFQLEMAVKNRPGNHVPDFRFVTADNRTASLYNLKSDYTLLFFYMPDCPVCASWREYLQASALLGQITEGSHKRMQVVAVYPEDDVELWRGHLPEMPHRWLVGYDRSGALDRERLFDLRATPTLYLLDAQKRVLLKNVGPDVVERYLTSEIQLDY